MLPRLALSGLLLVAASGRASARPSYHCVSDIYHANPDGSLCKNGPDVKDEESAPPAVSPEMKDLGTAAGRAIGAAFGAMLVPSQPPIKSHYGTLRNQRLNEKVDDGTDEANSASVKMAQGILDDFNSSPDELKEAPDRQRKAEPRAIRGCRARKSDQCPAPLTDAEFDRLMSNERRQFNKKYVNGRKGKGKSIDCSGLIDSGNPEYWSAKATTPCRVGTCGKGTEQQLSLLENTNREGIKEPNELKKGDVAFFTGSDGAMEHVVQVTGAPVLNADKQLVVPIASASSVSGKSGVSRLILTAGKDGRYSYGFKDKQGKTRVQYFLAAGTPKPPKE